MENLRQINELLTPFYVPAWLKSSDGTDVACEDLTFLPDMITCKNFAPVIAKTAFQEFAKLECFWSEETVVFALFSDYSELTNKKRKLKEKIYKKYLVPRSDKFSRGIPVAKAITIDHATELHDMIRPESWLLFQPINVHYSGSAVLPSCGMLLNLTELPKTLFAPLRW